MKTKPILIATGVIILIACVLLFVRSRSLNKPQKNEVVNFLVSFEKQLKANDTDSLLSYFETNQKKIILIRLCNVLSGRTGLKDLSRPLFNVSPDFGGSKVKILNTELAEAKVTVNFSHDSLESRQSSITFKVRKLAKGQFKIVQVNANKFVNDYADYDNYVRSKTLSDAVVYSPLTLQSFETAKQLKTRYDSVVWFAHLDKKTFFYVVKGKWNMDKYIDRGGDTVSAHYTMGLVSPDLKEIIPAEYDLIHNINGTFPGMVEVEKDNKKGFYDLDGKITIPVNYDQIFPIDDDTNLAVLKNGNDYFYLKKDMSISDKVDLKISDFFSKIKNIANPLNLYTNALSVITEYNSREQQGAIYISPSYLVDLNMIGKVNDFKNPLRKVNDDEVHVNYKINFSSEVKDDNNWLQASFYSIRDYFLGGRSEFYDKKNLVVVDKKNNRVLTADIGIDYSRDETEESALEGVCDVNSIKVINDSLFEVKAGAGLYAELYDSTKTIVGGTYYHYLAVKNNKMAEMRNNRTFAFTKYVKMDDSYLNGCYNLLVGPGRYNERKNKTIDHITPEILRYIKNEIYADYGYAFKDKRWKNVFAEMQSYYKNGVQDWPGNASVDDSLTTIDKYNINWINQKLKEDKTGATTLASK